MLTMLILYFKYICICVFCHFLLHCINPRAEIHEAHFEKAPFLGIASCNDTGDHMAFQYGLLAESMEKLFQQELWMSLEYKSGKLFLSDFFFSLIISYK